MKSNCNSNRIILVRGNDTNFNGVNFLTIKLTTTILDLSTFKAVFKLNDIIKTFPDLSSGIITLNFSAQETMSLPETIDGTLQLIDNTNKIATIESLIPFRVISVVHGNAIATEPYTLNFDVQQGGETILNVDVQVGISVEVGTTTTLPPGSDASVINVGTDNRLVLNFGIPEGIQGEQGESATIEVGTTTTGAPGSSASVINSGTSSAAVFNFVIPQGIPGETGEDGFSPIANVVTSGGVTTITITDKVGTTSSSIIIPTKISDLTDDTDTYPIDKADTLTGLTATITELNYTDGVTSSIQTQFNNITAKIPAEASAGNQLADKDFVNSSIATNTATFIGTFENESALEAYAGTVTNNDYAFVINSVVTDNGNDWADFASLDAYSKTHLTNFDYAWVVNGSNFDLYRFDIVEQEWVSRATNITKDSVTLNAAYNRYKAVVENSVVTWTYEYTLNNSSFTAAQWAAINSGITSGAVGQITTNQNAIGTLSSLATTDKTNLVSAINEVNSTASGKVSDVKVNGSSVVTSGVANIDLSGYVTTSTAQDITETKTFKEQQKFQSGSAEGCIVIGADALATTVTANRRKLGRMTFHTKASTTLNCAFVSTDTQYGSSAASDVNCVEFGGRTGDVTATSPDKITFTVAKVHNTITENEKLLVAEYDKDGIYFYARPKYNGNNLITASDIPVQYAMIIEDFTV